MNVLLEPARLGDVYAEVVLPNGDVVTYYTLRMYMLVGTEGMSPIQRAAVALSRSCKVNDDDVGPDFFLGMTQDDWAMYMEHFKT